MFKCHYCCDYNNEIFKCHYYCHYNNMQCLNAWSFVMVWLWLRSRCRDPDWRHLRLGPINLAHYQSHGNIDLHIKTMVDDWLIDVLWCYTVWNKWKFNFHSVSVISHDGELKYYIQAFRRWLPWHPKRIQNPKMQVSWEQNHFISKPHASHEFQWIPWELKCVVSKNPEPATNTRWCHWTPYALHIMHYDPSRPL